MADQETNNAHKYPPVTLGIIMQPGYDSDDGVLGFGFSPDNGRHFYVTNTVKGRKYRQDDAEKISALLFDKIKLKSPSGTAFYLSVADDGTLKTTKVGDSE